MPRDAALVFKPASVLLLFVTEILVLFGERWFRRREELWVSLWNLLVGDLILCHGSQKRRSYVENGFMITQWLY